MGALVAGVGVPVGGALVLPGPVQGLLEVLQGHPGRPAADPAADAAEQPVLLVVLLQGVLGVVGVLGEGGMQRRAGLPRLSVDNGLRQGARQGAEDDPALHQGHPAVEAVDVALGSAPGRLLYKASSSRAGAARRSRYGRPPAGYERSDVQVAVHQAQQRLGVEERG
ncbi:hypothetical protein [Kitasatospora sp. NPDC051705]|uniref:hypothetical protein n=1 Tax=Kitasatospora sp. NPDC051705 TaxID=3364057 RepID=UPI0037A0BAF5